MKTFSLVKGSLILIYGAGAFGQSIYSKVKDIYDVQCFVDKRVSYIKNIDIPVKDLNHISEYEDCSVIICVHDGNWHYQIAEDLHERGFEQIVFLALSDVYKKNESLLMKKVYSLFLEEQYESLTEIPCYSDMKRDIFEENVIRKNDVFVTAYCGRELLFSYDKIDEHQKGKISEEALSFWDVPMIVFKPFVSLFRFFMYGEGSSDLYVRTIRKLNNSFDMGEEEFLQSQYLIYQLLEKEYEKGIEVFQYAPIDVKWNPRGYFNVVDGHHRCIFYCLKGMQNLPVRMTREDYDIWMNRYPLEKIKEILQNNIGALKMRINHPVLGDCKCQYMEYENTILDVMENWIYDEKLMFRSVVELSDCQAYYSRNLYRMKKADEITALTRTAEDMLIADVLNRLQYVPENAVRITASTERCFQEKNQYNLAIICNMYDVNELEEIIDGLDRSITDAIFWQSKSDIKAEKEYILSYSGFCDYKLLATKCVNGKLCEIGIFSKGGTSL